MVLRLNHLDKECFANNSLKGNRKSADKFQKSRSNNGEMLFSRKLIDKCQIIVSRYVFHYHFLHYYFLLKKFNTSTPVAFSLKKNTFYHQ